MLRAYTRRRDGAGQPPVGATPRASSSSLSGAGDDCDCRLPSTFLLFEWAVVHAAGALVAALLQPPSVIGAVQLLLVLLCYQGGLPIFPCDVTARLCACA